jgi:hypothetical protein
MNKISIRTADCWGEEAALYFKVLFTTEKTMKDLIQTANSQMEV